MLVVVADDGVGLPEGVQWPERGKLSALILQSLRENAKARVEIESEPGQGMRVTITFTRAAAAPQPAGPFARLAIRRLGRLQPSAPRVTSGRISFGGKSCRIRMGKPDRVWSLMQDIKVAMVVTHDGHGDRFARQAHGGASRSPRKRYFFSDRCRARGRTTRSPATTMSVSPSPTSKGKNTCR